MRSAFLVCVVTATSSTVFAQDIDRTHFTLTLEDAVAAALKNSPAVQAAEAKVREASAGVRTAIARKNPVVGLNGFATAGSMQAIVGSAPGVDPVMYMPVTDETFVGLDLAFMVPLFTGGSLEGSIGAAGFEKLATLADLRETRADVALAVNEAYLGALRAYDFSAETSGVIQAEELVKITKAQYEAGSGIEASVARANAALSSARRKLLTAQNNRAKSLIDLRSAMAADQATGAAPTTRMELVKPGSDLDDFLRNAGLRRGSILAAKARLKSAEQRVRVAEGQLKPQLYGLAMADGSNDPAMRKGATFGIVASLPVFDSGLRRSSVAQARSQREQAAANLRAEVIRAEGEIRKAWLDVLTATATANSLQSEFEASKKAYAVAMLRFQAGKSTLYEQLDALNASSEAQTDFINALYEEQFAVARLYRAAGFIPGANGKEFDNGVAFGANPVVKPDLPPLIRPYEIGGQPRKEAKP